MHTILDPIRTFIAPWQKKLNGGRLAIGIDIGSSSVKAVQMAEVNGVMSVIKAALTDIEGGARDDQAVVNAIRAAVGGMAAEGARITAIVNCPQTCTRKIIAPNMPKKELADAVQWEAKNAIPYSIAGAGMDFKVLGEAAVKGVKKLSVSVAASPQETVQRVVGLCRQAGLELSALIPVSAAQENLIALLPALNKGTVAVVEMGAGVTELNIYADGKLDFSRKLPVAGNDITKSMTSALMSQQGKVELTTAEAEQIKKETGIPAADDAAAAGSKILPSQILSLIRPCVEQLAAEIGRSFDFYSEGAGGAKVSKIVLFGGGANLKGLVEFLRGELDTEVLVGDCLAHIKILPGALAGGGHPGSRFNLAIGAALDKPGGLNLLPAELKEKTRRFIESVSLKAVGTGLAVTLILLYAGLNIRIGTLNRKMEALRLEQRTSVTRLESARSLIVADRVLSGHPYWEDVLKEISNTVEQGMYLTELNMKGDVVNLRGVIQDDQSAQSHLSNFMMTLEEGIFRRVSLVTVEKQSDNAGASEFEITAEVD